MKRHKSETRVWRGRSYRRGGKRVSTLRLRAAARSDRKGV